MINIEVKNGYVDMDTLKPKARVTLSLDLDAILDTKALSTSDEFYKIFTEKFFSEFNNSDMGK